MEIKIATGICEIEQKLTPNDFDYAICELEDDDDVMCEINRNSCHHHPLLCAAGFGNVEAIRSWITSGADVDVKSEFEDTPLLSASFHIEDKCIKELLHLGTMHPFVTKTCLFRPNKQVFIRNGRNAPICNKNLFVSFAFSK
jgi:ankyrin repeat protein